MSCATPELNTSKHLVKAESLFLEFYMLQIRNRKSSNSTLAAAKDFSLQRQGLQHLSNDKRLRVLWLFSLGIKRFSLILSMPEGDVRRRKDKALFHGAQRQHQRQQAQTETQEDLPEH